MIRAKFRVLQINQYFHGKPFSQGVEMRPVMARCASYPDASEENAKFWEATPSGEIAISTDFGSDEFEGGECYYVDMVFDPEGGDWKLELEKWGSDSLGVKLCKNRKDHVSMSISNKDAWRAFLDAGPGSRWSVDFVKAPNTAEHESY